MPPELLPRALLPFVKPLQRTRARRKAALRLFKIARQRQVEKRRERGRRRGLPKARPVSNV